MKIITHLQFVFQKLAVRLFVGARTSADKQRGASALEYIVLAAVIVVAVIAGATLLAGEDGEGPIRTAFQDIVDSLTGAGGTGTGGGGN